MESIVKYVDDEEGYGFIEYKGNDILIHYCAFREHGKDEIVEFELVKTGTGFEIKNKVPLEEVA